MSNTEKKFVVLTGAGISSESGIPTFRGPQGYWTSGSGNYHPQELATRAMFSSQPWLVWSWYLHRLSVYRNAVPNPGHVALVEMEDLLQDGFCLLTQNIDNLHLKAGNSPDRTCQIHGNINFMRCFAECQGRVYPLPEQILNGDYSKESTDVEKSLPGCPDCGGLIRPHVLWFDECYDEIYFRYESALRAASDADVLIIAGTSGATTLPNLIVNAAYNNRATIIEINLETTRFSELARRSTGGRFLKASCSAGLGEVLELIKREYI